MFTDLHRPASAITEGAPRRTCASAAMHLRLLEAYPDIRKRQADLEKRTSSRMASKTVARSTPYGIRVVVHVLFHNETDNIPDERIHSQIDVLNEDFRARNADRVGVPAVWAGLVDDAMVEFELASQDPDGNPTTGITRTRTDVAEFEADDSMKSAATGGIDPWPTDRYLNIWVCRLNGGILGYAQFPNGPAHTDGVVILTTAFGRGDGTHPKFSLGRTTTHEVGHFLNLRHIWGDTEDCSGTDFVKDTPNAEGPNYDTPTFPEVSCNNGPNGDMFMNYMDYVDDAAMFMFTPGQVVRMHVALDGPRKSLVS